MLSIFALFGLFGVPNIVVIAALILVFIFEVFMFISAVGNEHISSDRRVLWVVGMLIIHPFVAIAYYLTDYKKIK